MKVRILSVFGTRPEAIKMAVLSQRLKEHPEFDYKICLTGQHNEMLAQVLEFFCIQGDFSLDVMTKNQTLTKLTSNLLLGLDKIMNDFHPHVILIQGDTNTTFAAALAAFYNKIRIGHIEAGLRTYNLDSPFPEEANRIMTSRIATYHFPPTTRNKNVLVAEGVDSKNLEITGNTGIDALVWAKDKMQREKLFSPELTYLFDKPFVLITGHRRENFGEGFNNICKAIKLLASKYLDFNFVYPVHLNPNVQMPVNNLIGGIENVKLIAPLSYPDFVYAMSKSYIILTDSGGVQEEAPGLGKPVLVMRDTTERPEAVEMGTVKLVGTDPGEIIQWTSKLIDNKKEYDRMAKAVNPYGDGKASMRIVSFLEKELLSN